MDGLRVLLATLVLVIGAVVPGGTQNPDYGVDADDINVAVETSVLEAVRANQGEHWKYHDSRRLGRATIEHEFHSMVGGRIRRLTTKINYMISESDADKCVDFHYIGTSQGGTALSGVGDEAYIWSHQGYASIAFRKGHVVAVVRIIDNETDDDLGPTVTDFAKVVVAGIEAGL